MVRASIVFMVEKNVYSDLGGPLGGGLGRTFAYPMDII